MKVHNSEMVDGLIDGHLKGWRRWLAQRHVSKCPVCALEYRHQLHVSRLLQETKTARKMPLAADAFWSRVQASIESQSPAAAPVRTPLPRLIVLDWFQERPALMPAMALAVVLVATGVFWLKRTAAPVAPVRPAQVVQRPPPAIPATPFAAVDHVETSIPDAVATPFRSQDAGVTVIWVSGLPWTEDMTELQTLYANLDS